MKGITKARAAKAKTKAQNNLVVVEKGKGKAAVVAGVPSKPTKKKGKEILNDPLPRISAYLNNTYRILLW